MALETRFYWHVSVLVKKKKKKKERFVSSTSYTNIASVPAYSSAYSFFDQRCLMGICFMNFGWFLSVKYIGWIFNKVNFGIYWRKMGASLIFFVVEIFILIRRRTVDIFCNQFMHYNFSFLGGGGKFVRLLVGA